MPSSRGTTAKSEAKRKKIVIEAKDAKGAAVLSLIEALRMFRFHRERHSHFPFFPLKWTPFSWKQVSILLFFFCLFSSLQVLMGKSIILLSSASQVYPYPLAEVKPREQHRSYNISWEVDQCGLQRAALTIA